MKEISNRRDIEQMVNSFYEKVKADEVIGFIFNDVAKVDWEAHLPVMYDFWESTLLGNPVYHRNAMEPHLHLHKEKISLKKEHFDEWLMLFKQNIDEQFTGEVAERAKQRAQSIATLMQVKIANTGK